MSAPATGFFTIGGTLRSDAPSYVERKADRDLLDGLLSGAFCYVLTSRQMGKSSLMVRTATRLREQGVQVVVLDLTAIGQNVTPEQWYDGLLVRMAGQLRLENELEEFWESHPRLSPVQRFFQALEEVVLRRRRGSLVVFVDEIDVVRSLSFSTDEFFAAIRELYNRRTGHQEMQRVTFCLLGVAAPGDLIRDTRMTPFNIGRRIELNDFTAEEAAPLARGLAAGGGGDTAAARAMMARVLHWTHGHPYLTQRFCQTLASRPASGPQSVDTVCEELFLSSRAREQDDNLLFVRDRLLRGQDDPAGVLTLYADALKGRPPVPDDVANPLVGIMRLSGIVRSERGRLRVRNAIYERVFDRKWIDANMPDAELRRQRAAFRRGVMQAASIAAAVVLALAGLWGYARWQAWRAGTALTRLTEATRRAAQAQSQTRRLLGLAGQRFEGLEAIRALAADGPTVELRNEAIACLALADMRSLPERAVGAGEIVALGDGLRQCLRAEPIGSLSLCRWQDGSLVSKVPVPVDPAARYRLSSRGGLMGVTTHRGGQTHGAVWRWAGGERILQLTNVAVSLPPEFNEDETLAAVAGPGAALGFFALSNAQAILRLEGPGPVVAVRFRPASSQFAVAWSNRFIVEVREPVAGETPQEYAVPSGVESLAWSPDGTQLAAACSDRRIYLWNIESGRRITLEGHQGVPEHLVFSPSGRMLASAGPDQTVRLWNAAGSGRLLVVWARPKVVRQLVFGRDDGELAAITERGMEVWEVAPMKECRELGGAGMLELSDFQVSPDGRWMAGAQADGVHFWDVETALKPGVMLLGDTRGVAFHPVTGELFASTPIGVSGYVRRERMAGRSLEVSLGPGRSLHRSAHPVLLGLEAGGDWLAVGWPGQVELLQTTDGAVRSAFSTGPGVASAAPSADGRWIAMAMDNAGEIRIRDMNSTNSPVTLRSGARAAVAFAPSGEWLAAVSDTECRVWRTGSWKEAWRLGRSTGSSKPPVLAFSPDSRTLALAGAHGPVELVEAASGVSLATLTPPRRDAALALRFSPDGTRLFCGTEGATVWIWDLWQLRQELARVDLDWPGTALAPRAAPLEDSRRLELLSVLSKDEADRVKKLGEIEELTRKLMQNPAESDLWHARAQRYLQLFDYEHAAADWRSFLALKKDSQPLNYEDWARRDLAWIYLWGPFALQDAALARELLSEAVRLKPKNPDNHHRLGAAQVRLGDWAAALASLRRAEQLASPEGSLPARILLLQAICLARLGQSAEAAQVRERISPGQRPSPTAPVSRSQIEWQQLQQDEKSVFGP